MARLYTIRNRAITEKGLEYRFDEFLDDVTPAINVCGYEYPASKVLREVDPVCYEQEMAAWLSFELDERRLIERDGEYFDGENDEES